ncbi:MAG TPA: family 43 glycosylhydrolase [Candidatus Mediterraneibacter avicola]|nr:family 43 glycosylhydrolase [Candidatus Mediterraneibacter avicola]
MKKKILSLLLAGGMILTSLVIPTGGASTVEAAPGDNLVAYYKFDGDFKDSVDSSIEGTPANTNVPTTATDDVRDGVMKSGSGKGRIRTENPLYQTDLSSSGFTVSAWIDANAVDSYNGVWSFSSGDSDLDGFYGLSTNGSLYFNNSPRQGTTTYQDMKEFAGNITVDGGWEHITVVMDTQKIHMYKDGALVYELTPSTLGNSSGQGTPFMLDFVETTEYIWFGTASPHYWSSGDFYMDDFKVYSKALTAEEVAQEYLSDSIAAKEVVAADKEALSIPESTMLDLELPNTGKSGFTTITWSSDSPNVISNDGKVTRPENDTDVKLTATITAGTESDTKTFTVRVPKANPEEDLKLFAEQLTLNAGYISEDITLPTSTGDAKVDWDSSKPDVISKYGKVTRPDENTDVTLTATLSLDGTEEVTKEFKVKVLAKGGNVATYVSNDPGLNTDALKGQIGGMMIAAENEEGTYDVLHKEQPIMYTAKGVKAYVSPQVFRKADGKFGMIAADGGNNNTVFLYDTENLITYTGETSVTLNGVANISKLYMIYDMTAQEYRLFVENKAGTVYLLTSKDLKTFSAAEQTDFVIPEVTNAPEYAVWASETALTQAEYDTVTNKFTNPYNTSLEYNKQDEITVEAGADIEAALDEAFGEVTAEYSNGEQKPYSIRWNSDDLEKADSTRSGMEYTIRGTIGGSAYFTEAEAPLIEERADPSITYDEDLDRYYFTASYPVNGKEGADGYDRLVIRVADTIEGLADAEEYVIWDESETEGYGQFIWAPELHKIGGSWYFISTAAVGEGGYSFDIRPFMMKCNDVTNITDPDSWGDPVRVEPKKGDKSCLQVMSLDMTYFEAGGKSYVSWADKTQQNLSKVFIATVDPKEPWKLTSNATVLTTPEYSWECVNIAVNEGSAAFVKDGTVYLAFSAAATGAEYCVGLMTADADADLTNVDNWTKVPYPVLTSGDFNDELCGPGHNSFTTDEYGNLVIVYHARPAEEHAGHSGDPLYDACRHAYVKPVLFDSEDMPVLNLSDEEFAMGGSEITVKVKVEGEYEEAKPVLEYNFDEELTDGKAKDSAGGNDATLHGEPAYVQDESYGQVLYLDGDNGDYMGGHDSYLEFPQGFFDGMDNVTISMDVNEVSRTGAYFTFGVGQDRNKYFFLKMQPTNLKLAITENTWSGEQVAEKSGAYPNNSRTWMNLKIVATPDRISLYRDGELIAERDVTVSMSDLGDDLLAYLGKSFYDEDLYFRGFFDNVKVYNFAMSGDEIARVYADEEAERIAMLEDVQRVADLFEIPNIDDIRGNITLPSVKDGVDISWTSSNEAVITSKEVSGKPAGVVTRQEKDTDVTLTAVFSKEGQESVTKTYDVTVKAKAPEVTEDDYVGYLFVHFIGNEAAASHEQTYFSISEDGLNWSELNGGKAVLTSSIGESGLRDHYIARAPEGDKYYMIATDLSIYHNQDGNSTWANAGGSGSHGIVVWESNDLVNWSEPWIAEIAPENAGCTWAPEFIYDESTGEYVVYWSATSIELNDDGSIKQEYENHTIYYAKTRDFRTFTDAEVYHSGGVNSEGKPIKVIDSTMIEHDGTYYRYTKNEMNSTIMIDKSDSILGEFTEIESDTLSTDAPTNPNVGLLEGPIIFKLNERTADGKEQWCLMGDRFATNRGYYPMITTDLESGEFRMLDDDEFSMPTNVQKYRHGYVMPVTEKEYDALQRKWGGDDYFSTFVLEDTIANAKAVNLNELTADSEAELTAAIKAAEARLAELTGSNDMDAVEEAAAELQSVIDNLVYFSTKELDDAIVAAEAIDPATLTEDSAAALADAIDAAKAAREAAAASRDQDAVKAAADTLNNVLGDLEYKVVRTFLSLEITAPTKTQYTLGEEFSAAGLKVYAVWDIDGKTVRFDVTDQAEVIAPDMKSVGDKLVTVRYTYTDDGGNEQTAETKFAIKVNPAPADEEERPTDPNQTPPQEGGAVQTGDTTDILPTAAACILAFAAAAAIAALKRRKRF